MVSLVEIPCEFVKRAGGTDRYDFTIIRSHWIIMERFSFFNPPLTASVCILLNQEVCCQYPLVDLNKYYRKRELTAELIEFTRWRAVANLKNYFYYRNQPIGTGMSFLQVLLINLKSKPCIAKLCSCKIIEFAPFGMGSILGRHATSKARLPSDHRGQTVWAIFSDLMVVRPAIQHQEINCHSNVMKVVVCSMSLQTRGKEGPNHHQLKLTSWSHWICIERLGILSVHIRCPLATSDVPI